MFRRAYAILSTIAVSHPMASPTPRTILAIDLTRFACAASVMGYHYSAAFWSLPDGRVASALQGVAATPVPLARAGLVGVELFFVISGMVIARSAVGASWQDFLGRRVVRLVPAAWICATLTALVLIAGGQGDATLAADWFRSVRFWPIGAQIDGSYWTLGVECAFYLLIALAGVGDARRIALVGWALALASAAFWTVCLLLGPGAEPIITNQAAILLLLPHGCFFAAGIALASRGMRGSTALLALAGATGVVEVAAHIGGGQITPATIAGVALFVLGLTTLAAARRLQPWLAQRLDSGVARAIGLMTYPLYLLHQVAGAALIGMLARSGVPLGVAIGLTVAVMLASAWMVARHAEPAVRTALQTLVRPRRGRAPDSLRSAFPRAD